MRTRRMLRNAAFQDFVAVAFGLYMFGRALLSPPGPHTTTARLFAVTLLSVTVATIVLVRGELLRPGLARGIVYRLGLVGSVQASYFELRHLLAALGTPIHDDALHAIDRAIFRVTPSVWLERFNEPAIIEWFAFFYYLYFLILAGVILPSLFLDRGRRLRELMVGALVVVAVGHVLYTLVPAYGPYVAAEFDAPLRGGLFLGLVQETVASAGALMDIFPSLHTAFPLYFALHAFGHRDRAPFRYLWPVLAFLSANIIVATMLLRWHWGIDILAGIALAVTARIVAVIVARREAREDETARQPVWEPLRREPPRSARADMEQSGR